MALTRIGVLSDTHGFLHPEVFEHFRDVRLILHAGDLGDPDIATELETLAPVLAVRGNVDSDLPTDRFPMIRIVPIDQKVIVLTHGHLQSEAGTRTSTLIRTYSEHQPDAIVVGHSHEPRIEREGELLVFNPGAAGKPRFSIKPSIGILWWEDHTPIMAKHISLTWPFIR